LSPTAFVADRSAGRIPVIRNQPKTPPPTRISIPFVPHRSRSDRPP